jgi:hypothetical protein
MNTRTKLLIAIPILLLVGLMIYSMRGGKQGSAFDWAEGGWNKNSYSQKNIQPYGGQLLARLLDQQPATRPVQIINDALVGALPHAAQNGRYGTYMFVGEAIYLDSADTEHLKRFVSLGGTAFLASKSIPFDLANYIYYTECDNELGWEDYLHHTDTAEVATLTGMKIPPTPLGYYRQNKLTEYRWSYMPNHLFCPQLSQQPLGFLDSTRINFARFPYGNGQFLLLSTPIALSNYHLTRPENRPYVEGLLSWLPEGPVYWDDFSRVPEAVGRRRNQQSGQSANDTSLDADHPLSFVLKQEALAWTWYLLTGLLLAFVAFRGRRRQRIIPVLKPKENTSREFVSTVADLQFRNRNYSGTAYSAMRLHLHQIRERYQLSATLDPKTGLTKTEPDFFERLSRVSDYPEAQTRSLFHLYDDVARFSATQEQLIELHQAIEHFWLKAK